MEWDEVSYCAPESFFDPSLESMDSFPKNLFTDVTGVNSDYTEPRDVDSLLRTEDDDFRDLLEDTLLSDGPLTSVLSSEEIFSQIEICSDLLEDNAVNSSSSDNSAGDANSSSDEPPVVKQESTEEIDLNLEKVECDIAKLKQEVDFTSDDDSMWSDFFCEDDASEISKEYDDLLKYLLTQPVDDFDLTLNVFNNVEEEENRLDAETASPKVEEVSKETCLEHILADHCYTLPFEESSVLLTPPNSSDDSEPESEQSSQPSPRKISLKSDSSKYTHKTVKLKHKKDLKFVFSIKVKENQCQGNPSPGRSLLKKNHIQSFNSSKQLVREVLQKRAYRKRHKLNEAALAVQSLLDQENRDTFQHDRLLKMQTEREIHNSMERQRRIELKNELDKLKSLIPEIADSEKVSKLNVLNYSADYVKRLEKTDLKLKMKISYLREKRQRLTDQLNRLKSY